MIYEKYPELKVQIPEQRVLVQRVLCGYSREECKENRGVHKASVG